MNPNGAESCNPSARSRAPTVLVCLSVVFGSERSLTELAKGLAARRNRGAEYGLQPARGTPNGRDPRQWGAVLQRAGLDLPVRLSDRLPPDDGHPLPTQCSSALRARSFRAMGEDPHLLGLSIL